MTALAALDVDKVRCLRVLRRELVPKVVPGKPEMFGPSGFRTVLYENDLPIGSVIVTQAEHDGAEWIHASIAFVHEDPSYLDLRTLKAAVFGSNREAYQVFPPSDRHVNIHEHALHLWGRADGSGVLPAFGSDGSI